MVVQSLSHQHLGKITLLTRVLLDLGPLVLEPNLDLVLIQPQFLREVSSAFFGQVPVLFKLPFEPAQLIRGEGCPWPFLCR